MKLVATPKLDEHVYQIVALKNPAAYPLLEGRVRSYRDGSYVGDSQPAPPGRRARRSRSRWASTRS